MKSVTVITSLQWDMDSMIMKIFIDIKLYEFDTFTRLQHVMSHSSDKLGEKGVRIH